MSLDTSYLHMTPEEICRSYREAKDPNGQIKILADLNCTNTDFIVEILKENGEPLKKRPYQRPSKKDADTGKAPEQKAKKKEPLPEAVREAILRRIADIDEVLADTRTVLEKNTKQRQELEEFLRTYGEE